MTSAPQSPLDIPHDLATEKAVLAIPFIEPDKASERLRLLSPRLFHDIRHRAIFCALLRLAADGNPPDTILLMQKLKATGDIEAAGGPAFFASLPDEKVLPCLFEVHLATLKKLAHLRDALELSDRLREAVAGGEDGEMLFESAAGYIQSCRAESFAPASAPRAWLEIGEDVKPDDVLIGPGRWLTRGSGCFVVAPTGAGKSTWIATQAFSWGIGRESLGLCPTGPLKSLIFQAEDDPGDLLDMRDGIMAALRPSADERELIKANVLIVTEREITGLDFLERCVRPRLDTVRPDLVWINPLSAYFGDDLNDQRAVSAFFRNRLNSMLAEYRCACFPVHHCAKPSKERDAWRDGSLAYFGSGSADLANWSRETLTLRQTAPGLYELTATKRWRKLGWRDGDGKPTATRLIAHARDGSMVWQDATDEVLAELGATPYTAAALCALVPSAGIDKAELVRGAIETFTISERTAKTYIADACREKRNTVNGQSVKCALFKASERPRREVYPDQPKNRPVVWLTLTPEVVRLCNR